MQPQMQRRPIVRPLDGAGGRKRTLPWRGQREKKGAERYRHRGESAFGKEVLGSFKHAASDGDSPADRAVTGSSNRFLLFLALSIRTRLNNTSIE